MIVAGIDENGYGPKLGPLVATSVAVLAEDPEATRLTGREKFVRDSKAVFRRSPRSYAQGERTALAILGRAGHRPGTFFELLDVVALERFEESCLAAGPTAARALDRHGRDLRLPVWDRAGGGATAGLLEEIGRWAVRGVACAVLMPLAFNRMVSEQGTKSYCDFSLFMDLATGGPRAATHVLGKIGGQRRYGTLFEKHRANRNGIGSDWKPLQERPRRSIYRTEDGREFRFEQDADAAYAPVALASIVGKYVRELFMLVISRALGYEDLTPAVTGYPGDPRTAGILSRLRGEPAEFPESEWIRCR